MVGAMNETDYANAWLCGAYVQISGPEGVGACADRRSLPGVQASGDIDLSHEAFAKIAEMVAGRVPVTWRLVSPALSEPIRYRFKEGSSKWWTAVQIRNHRTPIWRVEYRAGSGAFKEAPRERYNCFIETAGMGDSPYTFRVTDIFGQTLTDTGIALVEGGEVAGKGQFSAMANPEQKNRVPSGRTKNKRTALRWRCSRTERLFFVLTSVSLDIRQLVGVAEGANAGDLLGLDRVGKDSL